MDLWDMVQHQQIKSVQREVQGLRSETYNTARETMENVTMPLEKRVDKLSLICHALWTLLTDHTDLTEDDLNRRVTEIDMQDGQLDGKLNTGPVMCPKCQSAICKQFNRCLFCGEEYTGGSAFDSV